MVKQKVVGIIGGGVAGLSAGSFLARQGFHVKLFEANEKLGGCCATTNIGGYTFNDGALYLALPGMLDHVFKEIGLDMQAILPLRKITAGHTTLLPDESTVTVGGHRGLVLQREGHTLDNGIVQEDLRRTLEKWEPVLRLFETDVLLHPFSMGHMLRKAWRHLPKLRGDVASELRTLFRDEAVRAALSGALLFSGLPPHKTPVISLLGVISLLCEGFYLPEGGMGKIPEALQKGLTENDGEIHLNTPVKRIILKNGDVSGLDIDGEGQVCVDAVISTVSGMITWNRLLTQEEVPVNMRRRVEKAPISHKALSLQLGLTNKINVGSHSINILPWMEDQGQVFTPHEAEVRWPIFFVPTVTMPELAPPGGSIVEMYPPIPQDLPPEEWSKEWADLIVEGALKSLGSRYKMEIAVRRVLTPSDFQNRLHLYKGALYGLSPTVDPRAQFPHKTPVRGLFQAGQTSYPGYGVSASAMSGILAAQALIKAGS